MSEDRKDSARLEYSSARQELISTHPSTDSAAYDIAWQFLAWVQKHPFKATLIFLVLMSAIFLPIAAAMLPPAQDIAPPQPESDDTTPFSPLPATHAYTDTDSSVIPFSGPFSFRAAHEEVRALRPIDMIKELSKHKAGAFDADSDKYIVIDEDWVVEAESIAPLLTSIRYGFHHTFLNLLGALLKITPDEAKRGLLNNFLQVAYINDQADVLETLLEQGAELATLSDGHPLLMMPVLQGHLKTFLKLTDIYQGSELVALFQDNVDGDRTILDLIRKLRHVNMLKRYYQLTGEPVSPRDKTLILIYEMLATHAVKHNQSPFFMQAENGADYLIYHPIFTEPNGKTPNNLKIMSIGEVPELFIQALAQKLNRSQYYKLEEMFISVEDFLRKHPEIKAQVEGLPNKNELVRQLPEFILFSRDYKSLGAHLANINPYHILAATGDEKAIRYLAGLRYLAGKEEIIEPLFFMDDFCRQPIHNAILAGHEKVVKLIITIARKHGFLGELQLPDIYGNNAADLAIYSGHTEILDQLLETGLFNFLERPYATVEELTLTKAIRIGRSFEMYLHLLEVEPTLPDFTLERIRSGRNLFVMMMEASKHYVRTKDPQQLKDIRLLSLIMKWTDPDVIYRIAFINDTQWTPLQIALIMLERGHLSKDKFHRILPYEKNLNRQSSNGQVVLHQAYILGFPDIAEELIALGANPTIKDKTGLTPADYQSRHSMLMKLFSFVKNVVKVILTYNSFTIASIVHGLLLGAYTIFLKLKNIWQNTRRQIISMQTQQRRTPKARKKQATDKKQSYRRTRPPQSRDTATRPTTPLHLQFMPRLPDEVKQKIKVEHHKDKTHVSIDKQGLSETFTLKHEDLQFNVPYSYLYRVLIELKDEKTLGIEIESETDDTFSFILTGQQLSMLNNAIWNKLLESDFYMMSWQPILLEKWSSVEESYIALETEVEETITQLNALIVKLNKGEALYLQSHPGQEWKQGNSRIMEVSLFKDELERLQKDMRSMQEQEGELTCYSEATRFQRDMLGIERRLNLLVQGQTKLNMRLNNMNNRVNQAYANLEARLSSTPPSMTHRTRPQFRPTMRKTKKAQSSKPTPSRREDKKGKGKFEERPEKLSSPGEESLLMPSASVSEMYGEASDAQTPTTVVIQKYKKTKLQEFIKRYNNEQRRHLSSTATDTKLFALKGWVITIVLGLFKNHVAMTNTILCEKDKAALYDIRSILCHNINVVEEEELTDLINQLRELDHVDNRIKLNELIKSSILYKKHQKQLESKTLSKHTEEEQHNALEFLPQVLDLLKIIAESGKSSEKKTTPDAIVLRCLFIQIGYSWKMQHSDLHEEFREFISDIFGEQAADTTIAYLNQMTEFRNHEAHEVDTNPVMHAKKALAEVKKVADKLDMFLLHKRGEVHSSGASSSSRALAPSFGA